MKIYINRKPIQGPWGGGNKTVESLVSHLIECGDQVTFNILDNDIDIIFCMDPRPNDNQIWYQDFLTYRLKNKKTKIVQRIGDVGTHSKPELTELVRQSSALSDYNIFPSKWAMNYINYNKNNYNIIPNRPQDIFYKFRKNRKLKEKIKIVTHHWSTNPKKGFNFYKNISENRPDIDFTYIGRLPEDLILENTNIIPPMTADSLSKKLPEYDIYLTASIEEAGANHVLEAMAAGLPVIYHKDGGSISEYCKEYGIEFSSHNNINQKIDKMIRNFNQYKEKTMSYNQKIEETIRNYREIFCEIQG